MQIEGTKGAIGFSEKGEGPALILMHSLLADAASFARVEEALARDFRVVTLDLPGFGASAPIDGGLGDFADWAADAIRLIAPGPAPIVLGNGFGAFIALALAIRHPTLASRLVLASCGAAFNPEGRAAFRAMAAAAAAKGLQAISEVAMRRLFAPAFQEANPELMAERRTAFLRTDTAVFQAACEALATLDARAGVAGVTLPVLVVAGAEDEATPPEMGRELAALMPNARFVLLEGCAHVPQLQMPDVFLDAIGDFMGARPRVRTAV